MVPHGVTIRLGPRALGLMPPCLITPRGTVPDSHRLFLGVRDLWGGSPCSGGEGLSPQVLEPVRKGFCHCQRGLSYRGGAGLTSCLCRRRRTPKPGLERFGVRYSRTFLQRALSVYGYVQLSGVLSDTVPSDPDGHGQCRAPERPPDPAWYGSLLSLVPFCDTPNVTIAATMLEQ
jgi:hypothetical protein